MAKAVLPSEPKPGTSNYKLEVPLSASEIEDFKSDQPLKVVAQDRKGTFHSKAVQLDARGGGAATFAFEQNPGALSLAVGPADATDEELFALQTIRLDLPASRWKEREIKLPAVRISAFYWHWWRRWCRKITIRGRVLCPDGSPVPGAKVCAFDVDWWWWWLSKQQIGCATTDANGAFEISFKWCCGWWPFWWWSRRHWLLEPLLAEKIFPVLQRQPGFSRLASPSPQPDLALFNQLLSTEAASRPLPSVGASPAALAGLRDSLLQRLPVAPELERLRIWPWWPWQPWWDCSPDIIFKVTQNCQGQDKIIVEENFGDARWNITSPLDVTLTANKEACCIHHCLHPQECPEGNCIVITQACSIQVDAIGGNPGAPTGPAGFANPGLVSAAGDRPFAGVIPISGVFGDTVSVDYYEFEWRKAGSAVWNDMPAAAAGGVTRWFWGPPLGGGPVGFHAVSFPVQSISGRNVIESRDHFEANNDPLSWGLTRFWTYNRDLLMVWNTQNTFADGTYHLRVKSWDLVAGNLANERILPLCDTEKDNSLTLTLDNRPDPGPGSGHPASSPSHACGAGTVHVCTLEPDTDFLAVRVNGVAVNACSQAEGKDGGSLEIDFLADDPDGHLAYFTLLATYGENLAVNLLACPGISLVPLGGGPVPAAAQVGPDYGDALGQGAVAPIWRGGAMRLTVPLKCAFPESCCYQLELRAYKRTIVDCSGSFSAHSNLSTYTFGVVV